MRPQVRTLALALAIAAAALFAHWHFARLAGAQAPRVFYDSQAYLQIAARPIGIDRLWDYKPLVVPLIDGAVGGDPRAIQIVQIVVALVAWTAFAVALASALRRLWVRALAVLVAIAFLLAAPRIGWTAAVLSESLDDSLLALVIAGALGMVALRDRRRTWPARAVAVATGLAGVAWVWTRDTNAITAIVAVAVGALAWSPRTAWRARGIAFAALALAVSIIAIASTRIVPEQLPFQRGWWAPALTARATYPVADNILGRVLADDPAWLAERGAPIADLARLKDADILVGTVPDHVPAQDWVLAHGASTYVRWLVRHPIDRIAELGADWVTVLVGRHTASMPDGWVAHDRDHVVVEAVRRLTTSRYLLLALLVAWPLLVFRPRKDALRGLALVLVASGLVGAVAAYYGDSAELSRHCYGSGQQIAIGLFVALLARLDQLQVRYGRASSSAS